MKLKHLITEANRSLYEKVSEHYPVQLRKSKEDSWSTVVDADKMIISYSDTSSPVSAFTHELLHVETQLLGYRRLRAGLSLNPAVHRQLPFLCETIDNEFQHLKMQGRFVDMGLPANEFHLHTDTIKESYLERGLLSKGQSLLSVAMVYFTFITRSDTLSAERVTELKEQFRNYDEGSFSKNFDGMDESIAQWIASPNYEAERYLQQLLTAMGAIGTWISYVPVEDNPAFPEDGFFVSREFTQQEAQDVFARTGLSRQPI